MPGGESAKTVKIILASQSRGRFQMMKNAGISFKVVKPMLDEMAVIHDMIHYTSKEKLTPAIIAMELAKKKALAVSRKNPDALVIGSDQILVAEGRMISKARDMEEAKEKLKFLRGKTHSLISAVTVAKAETVFWSHESESLLTMHDFDDEFLEAYCGVAGDALTRAVGAYEIEGPGAWLFSDVKGDQFTVMGMPLLPLLGYLRAYHGIAP